mmetsp:Transcript_50762/g.135384  ORF Transcript_50762/g.135384 Transcript_50762/m.135384 type:complete len:268 (+) Transcript_50762:194-997(+)
MWLTSPCAWCVVKTPNPTTGPVYQQPRLEALNFMKQPDLTISATRPSMPHQNNYCHDAKKCDEGQNAKRASVPGILLLIGFHDQPCARGCSIIGERHVGLDARQRLSRGPCLLSKIHHGLVHVRYLSGNPRDGLSVHLDILSLHFDISEAHVINHLFPTRCNNRRRQLVVCDFCIHGSQLQPVTRHSNFPLGTLRLRGLIRPPVVVEVPARAGQVLSELLVHQASVCLTLACLLRHKGLQQPPGLLHMGLASPQGVLCLLLAVPVWR